MDESEDTPVDSKALARTATLLLSLAVIAERAARRSLPVRLLLFWILRPAERAAWRLLPFPPDTCDALRTDLPGLHDPDIAPSALIRLAVSFRTIAALLGQWMSYEDDVWFVEIDAFPTRLLRAGARQHAAAGLWLTPLAAPPIRLNDTS